MATLYYVHDPMCSWCWGFSNVRQRLFATLPPQIEVVRLLGGLAEDTDTPMPASQRQTLKQTWERIAIKIPGVEFNFSYWDSGTPRRSTYPACRAVIAARLQGSEYDGKMTEAIQHAYYLQARNPSNETTLIELADDLGLDTAAFTLALRAPLTQAQLLTEITEARRMGADSYPSLVLHHLGSVWNIPIDYNEVEPMRNLINHLIDEGER